MKREYAVELLVHELLNLLENDNNPYMACKKYINMSMEVGATMMHHTVVRQSHEKAVIMMNKYGEYLRTFNSLSEAARYVGIKHPTLSKACSGKYKTAGGYKWKYK